MRARKVGLVGSFLTLALACAFVVGCGGSDDPAPTSNVGDLNDPQFVVVNEFINSLVDTTVATFGNGLATITNISAQDDEIDPALQIVVPDGTKDSYGATYDNGWHHVWATFSGQNFVTTIHDSVQFRNQVGEAQQNPAGLSSLVYRHRWMLNFNDTTVTHTNMYGDANFTYAGLNTDQAIINGDNGFEATRKVVGQATTWHDLDISATYTNVTISKTPFGGWAQSCPESGAITGSVEYVRTVGAAAPDTTAWTFSLLFNNGQLDVQVVSGSTTWETSRDVCIVGGAQ